MLHECARLTSHRNDQKTKNHKERRRKRCSPGFLPQLHFWLHFAHVSAAIKNERKGTKYKKHQEGVERWGGRVVPRLANYEDLDKRLIFLAACPGSSSLVSSRFWPLRVFHFISFSVSCGTGACFSTHTHTHTHTKNCRLK